MDKQEYKILSEEITTLIANEQFAEAAEIADRIDWRKVRSFTTLQKISDLYKINRRYEDALDILLLAYDKNPGSRTIVYGLCELYLELDDLVSALKFLAMYKKIAPNDTGAYILQYKVLEREEASLEDRIELLEELNRKDYREEWAYQLAYLYHRIGFATKCVEACDQLITWFGDGPFVIKAMELKMLHQPLTQKQAELYDHRNDIEEEIKAYESDEYSVEKPEPGAMPEIGDEDFHVKTIDMGKFNTINLQKALAESMRELMGEEYTGSLGSTADLATDEEILSGGAAAGQETEVGVVYEEEAYEGEVIYEEIPYEEGMEEASEEVYEEIPYEEPVYEKAIEEAVLEEPVYEEAPLYEEAPTREDFSDPSQEPASKEEEEAQVSAISENVSADSKTGEIFFEDRTGDIVLDQPPLGMNPDFLYGQETELPKVETEVAPEKGITEITRTFEKVNPEVTAAPVIKKTGGKGVFDNVLSLDYDGQISLVVPEQMVEKQITGQMNLDEVMAEWENIRQKKERQQQEDVRRSIMERTGKIFADYDESSRHDLLAELEREQKLISKKYRANDIELRKVEEIEIEKEPEKEPEFEDLTQKTMSNIPTIWAEVDAAIEADKLAEGAVDVGAAVAAGTAAVLAGGAVAAAGAAGSAMAAVEGVAAAGSVVAAAEGVAAAGSVVAAAEGVAAAGSAVAAVESAVAAGNVVIAETDSPEEMQTEMPAEEYAPEYVEEYYEEVPYEEIPYEDEIIYEEIPYEEGMEEGTVEAEMTEEATPLAEEATENAIIEPEVIEETVPVAEEMTEEEPAMEEPSEEDAAEEVSELGQAVAKVMADDETAGTTLNTAQIDDIGSALEAAADKVGASAVEEMNDGNEAYDSEEEREFSNDELELFSDFMYSKKMRHQILDAIDLISLEPYVGNVIITGESGTGAIELAKDVIKEIQMIDSNFAANKVAKISGAKMNRKNIGSMFTQLSNGALIIEKAGELSKDTLENMTKVLESTQEGIIVIMTDSKREMEQLIKSYEVITGYFNARIDITPMNNNALVEYAKKYAYSLEYKIDEERAVLALHQRISELQIGEHHVTTKEVEEIIDEAIANSKRPRLSTYVDILVAKRYDYEDMIILKEKDFEN
ncbi:MAG: hypothetical protein E7285_04570 [Lachnospiraceae bacterium]|nr:hypothetical protein [Lachnospiraceae bacterium]